MSSSSPLGKCESLTQKDVRCSRNAVKGKKYCKQHETAAKPQRVLEDEEPKVAPKVAPKVVKTKVVPKVAAESGKVEPKIAAESGKVETKVAAESVQPVLILRPPSSQKVVKKKMSYLELDSLVQDIEYKDSIVQDIKREIDTLKDDKKNIKVALRGFIINYLNDQKRYSQFPNNPRLKTNVLNSKEKLKEEFQKQLIEISNNRELIRLQKISLKEAEVDYKNSIDLISTYHEDDQPIIKKRLNLSKMEEI